MRYIIIGLGNFGSALSIKLTAQGHEVIGVDNDMQKVELVKEHITHSIKMDSTDIQAMKALPLEDSDAVVVGIGEDFGSSIMTTAILKQLKVKKIISRAISPLHETVLESIGVDMIVHPEQETAERLAKKMEMTGVIDSFNISDEFPIIEITVPKRYVGKTIEQANFRERYNVNIVTIIKPIEKKNIFGIVQKRNKVMGVIFPNTLLEPNDILVVFGSEKDIERILVTDRDRD